MRRLAHNIEPLHNDKFYVYALFKPECYAPFYVGKGKGDRVNSHFKKSNLVKNTPKTGIIKKYGNSIKREILCYFDKESSAYDFEEYLIEYYGLESEGGCLVNYAKTRFQYSDKFTQDVSSKGHLSRKNKYSKEEILEVYRLYFKEALELSEIERLTGISCNYLYYVVSGKKWKSLYQDHTSSENFIDNQPKIKHIKYREEFYKISSKDLVNLFNRVCSLELSLRAASKLLGCSELWLSKVFLGKKRKSLNLDYDKYKALPKGTSANSIRTFELFKEAYERLGNIPDIATETGLGKTTCYRYLKRLRSENT